MINQVAILSVNVSNNMKISAKSMKMELSTVNVKIAGKAKTVQYLLAKT